MLWPNLNDFFLCVCVCLSGTGFAVCSTKESHDSDADLDVDGDDTLEYGKAQYPFLHTKPVLTYLMPRHTPSLTSY